LGVHKIWNGDSRKNADNRNNDQQFDERKSLSRFHEAASPFISLFHFKQKNKRLNDCIMPDIPRDDSVRKDFSFCQ
jgi:hypothetical protein